MTRSVTASLVLIVLLLLPLSASCWQVEEFARIPAGVSALGSGGNYIWCGYWTEGDSMMLKLNPDSGFAYEQLTPPEAHCYGIAYYQNVLWFLGEDTLYCLNAEGQIQERTAAPYAEMRGLAPTGNQFWTWAVINGTPYLVRVNTDGQELQRFQSDIVEAGDLAFDGNYLWVTSPSENLIYRIDPVTERVLDFFPTPGSHPRGIAVQDERVYLVDDGDAEDGDLIYQIAPGADPAPRMIPGTKFHEFGYVTNNMTVQWYLVVFNIGNLDLTVSRARLTGGHAGFLVGNPPPGGWQVSAGEYVQIQVAFTPDEYGTRSDTLSLESNDPSDSVTQVTLSGFSIYPYGNLGVSPQRADFGVVRADPWRDGSRLNQIYLVNEGLDDVRIDSIHNGIDDIFLVDKPILPAYIATAETLTVDIWFTPHSGIRFLDTLLIIARHTPIIGTLIPLAGQGSDSVFAGGTVLWQFATEPGIQGYGSAVRHRDITGDGITEAVVVGPEGSVWCLNGFGSGYDEVVWSQRFSGYGYHPELTPPSGCLVTGNDLDADEVGDIVFGSGGEDQAVYAVDGWNGGLIWRWSSRGGGGEGVITRILADQDISGDGAVDPVVLICDPAAASSRVVRLDGATGIAVWDRDLPETGSVASVGDLDRNGIAELALPAADSTLIVCRGTTGAVMRRIDFSDLGGIKLICPLGDLDGDGIDDLALSPKAGGVMGYSLAAREAVWYFDFGFQQPGLRYGSLVLLSREGNRLALGSESGYIITLNPASGNRSLWVQETGLTPSALCFTPDINDDLEADLAVGFESGLVEALSGADGSLLWSFPGDVHGTGRVGLVAPFDDVDLGGSADLLVMSHDGVARCISSYGDKPSRVSGDRRWLPEESGLLLYPNPFNGSTTLRFSLPAPGNARIGVWDSNGRLVSQRDLGVIPGGPHSIRFDPMNPGGVPGGVYFFRLEAGARMLTDRGVYVK